MKITIHERTKTRRTFGFILVAALALTVGADILANFEPDSM